MLFILHGLEDKGTGMSFFFMTDAPDFTTCYCFRRGGPPQDKPVTFCRHKGHFENDDRPALISRSYIVLSQEIQFSGCIKSSGMKFNLFCVGKRFVQGRYRINSKIKDPGGFQVFRRSGYGTPFRLVPAEFGNIEGQALTVMSIINIYSESLDGPHPAFQSSRLYLDHVPLFY